MEVEDQTAEVAVGELSRLAQEPHAAAHASARPEPRRPGLPDSLLPLAGLGVLAGRGIPAGRRRGVRWRGGVSGRGGALGRRPVLGRGPLPGRGGLLRRGRGTRRGAAWRRRRGQWSRPGRGLCCRGRWLIHADPCYPERLSGY
jgi:hypothetical protein